MPTLDPHDFWSLAQHLGESADPQDADLRTAVGRAYYAIFLIGRGKTFVRQKRGAHHEVSRRLYLRQGRRRIGDGFDELMRLREVADYELTPEKAEDRDWKRNWEDAEDIVNRILPLIEQL